MAAVSGNDSTFNPDLYLSPDQQNLLLAALSSNNPTGMSGSSTYPGAANPPNSNRAHTTNNPQPPSKHHKTTTDIMSNGFYSSPVQLTPGSVGLGADGLDGSPFIDYDLEDGSFDWDNSGDQLIGNIPGTSSNGDEGDLHDKRKSPDDEKDEEEGGGKRREGDDKTSKKPGRKPLTSEPTSVSSTPVLRDQQHANGFALKKRKAQNRAAQRAFRERKERHLKDLEIKVEDLEKASESANHENGLLRAQVEQLHAELQGYRKSLSLNGSGTSGRPAPLGAGRSSSIRDNLSSNNNFQFEFPKFGALPGSQLFTSNSLAKRDADKDPSITSKSVAVSYNVPGVVERNSFGSISPKTKLQQSGGVGKSLAITGGSVIPWSSSATSDSNGVEDLTGLFSPSILRNVTRTTSVDDISHNGSNNAAAYSSRRSTESSNGQNYVPQLTGGSMSSDSTSPSASSVSQHGPESSCGTSPEPCSHSPVNVKTGENGLNTINEEHLNKVNSEGEKSSYDEL